MEIVIDARQAWSVRVCGLASVRRHALLADRFGASAVTVVCEAGETGAIAALLVGTFARVTSDPGSLAEAVGAGAVLLPCTRVIDAHRLAQLAASAQPGAPACAGTSASQALGLDLPLGPEAERKLCASVHKPTDNWF